MSETVAKASINGVKTEQMGGTMQAVRQDPILAALRFRASNRWINGRP
jgi:hypothetical protein